MMSKPLFESKEDKLFRISTNFDRRKVQSVSDASHYQYNVGILQQYDVLVFTSYYDLMFMFQHSSSHWGVRGLINPQYINLHLLE